MIGSSKVMQNLKNAIRMAARSRAHVLVRGETGSGKELVARMIHQESIKNASPLVCVNCGGLTETLVESELFGHEKGAFTGATARRIGRFEEALDGTLFLDEIGELPLQLQPRLLRVLDGHPFSRIGGNSEILPNCRVVAATNRNLLEEVAAGRFREDLYHRLNVVPIVVPPLRKRPEDIPELVAFFVEKENRDHNRAAKFADRDIDRLCKYHWPGNVRELKHAVSRCFAMSATDELDIACLQLDMQEELHSSASLPSNVGYRPRSLKAVKEEHIDATLAYTKGNIEKAARILGVNSQTLRRREKRNAKCKSLCANRA